MSDIFCYYCNEHVPPDDYDAHMKNSHTFFTVQAMCRAKENYDLFNAMHHQRQWMPAHAAPHPPLASSFSAATLYDSATDARNMSVTLSAWQEQNEFAVARSTPYITADDVSSFRVDRSDEPRIAARSLQEMIKRDIQEFVKVFEGLGKKGRETCNDLVLKLPVFACLSACVFVHLKLCMGEHPSLLASFLSMAQEWINQPEEWCLFNYRTIESELLTFLKLSQLPNHICNRKLLHSARLYYLDIHSMAALAVIHCTDESRVSTFCAMSDDQARAILDLLQELIDLKSDRLNGWYKRRFLDAVVRLSSSRQPRLYPQSLVITGVDQVICTGDRGGFGALFYGMLSERVVALKELQTVGLNANDYLKNFFNDAVVLRNVQHRNCLPFYGVTTLVDDGILRTFVVSPCMTNGNLHFYLSQNRDVPRLPLLFDIASGLDYLHAMQPTVVHGDLRSANIFVTASGRACLADFGLTTVHDTQLSVITTLHGVNDTAGYVAPELLSDRRDLDGLDRRRCDMFAFGCIAYEVYTGGPPFQECIPAERIALVVNESRPQRPTDPRVGALGLDDDVWTLIESLWMHRPEARIVAASARDFLRFKLSITGQSASRWSDDHEWDTGFLSSPVANGRLYL